MKVATRRRGRSVSGYDQAVSHVAVPVDDLNADVRSGRHADGRIDHAGDLEGVHRGPGPARDRGQNDGRAMEGDAALGPVDGGADWDPLA